VIDWSKISIRPYIWASKRVKMVGTFVSSMLDFLIGHGLDVSQTALVGHSLGAHVVGLAARFAKDVVSYVVGRFLRLRTARSVEIASTGCNLR